MNYEIVEAKDPQEAVAKAKVKQGDLVVVQAVTASGNSDRTYTVRIDSVAPMPDSQWKYPVVPRHAVQMLVYDKNKKFILMHRSNNVRSARNVWSIPTGLHDIGETVSQTIYRELIEECGLTALDYELLGQYENIAGDPDATKQYHWVLSIYAVQVEDVTKMVNVEPEKHDELKFLPVAELLDSVKFLNDYKFHRSFQGHRPNWPVVYGTALLNLT
jgi:ADP-ribose pyrophosphatase YjhB (NUDIX family)